MVLSGGLQNAGLSALVFFVQQSENTLVCSMVL